MIKEENQLLLRLSIARIRKHDKGGKLFLHGQNITRIRKHDKEENYFSTDKILVE